MKIKRREAVFLLCIVMFGFCLLAGIAILLGKSANKPVNKKPAVEKTISAKKTEEEEGKAEKRAIEFENFNLLESVFMVNQLEDLKTQITDFLAKDSKYDSLTKVICQEPPISTETKVEFYCLLGEGNESVLRAAYNKEHNVFRFWTEDITPDKMAGDWEEKQKNHINVSEWETEEELPSEWTYVEEDKTKVTLTKKELLEDKIPKEKLGKLDLEIFEYLKENNEYRREMEVQNTIKDEGDTVEFVVKFKTQRIDKKDLYVVYDKKGDSYKFTLQEG